MSRDIRSFFASSKQISQNKTVKEDKPRKKPVTLTLSDDEEVKDPSPSKSKKTVENDNKKGHKTHSKKRVIESSDEDDVQEYYTCAKNKKAKFADNKSTSDVKKLEEVTDPAKLFNKKPIKRVNAVKVTKKATEEPVKKSKSHNSIVIDDDDDAFDATLNQLDTSQIEEEYMSKFKEETTSEFFKSEKEGTKKNEKVSPKKDDSSNKKDKSKSKDKDEISPSKQKKSKENGLDIQVSSSATSKIKEKHHSDTKHQNSKEKKRKDQSHPKLEIEKLKTSPKKDNSKDENVDYNDIIQEKIEKKKQHAALYHNYLNRGGAKNPGSKEIPQGAEQCLINSTFLITGVLDSLEREEAESIIKQYGGKIIHSVSKKLSYMIVGDEAGPSKLAKAESLGIKRIDEDGFLELIRSKPPGVQSKTSDKRKRETSSTQDEHQSPEKTKKAKENPSLPDSLFKDQHSILKKINDKLQETSSKEKQKNSEKIKETKKDFSLSNSLCQDQTSTFKKLKEKIYEVSSKDKQKSPEKLNKLQGEIVKDKNKSTEEIKPSISKPNIKASGSLISDISNKLSDGLDHMTALVEKYRPKDLKQIIGQAGDKSNAKKLYNWLNNWHKNHAKDAPKPKFSYKDDTGTIYKAALLSGPPGIGKTTSAYVVCAELGFEIIEFNASDTRSKKLLQDEIAGILTNKTMKSFMTQAPTKKKDTPRHVLLMDEVDGMAGNEDRGGMQELIAFIKSTEVPIICICNDRNSQKIKTLANYTFDLRFQKPRLEQIRAAMLSMCFKEGIKITPQEITLIIESTNQDIRQVINHLAILSAKSKSQSNKIEEKMKYKNLKLGPWDVVRKVFSIEEHKKMSIHDKSDLFFHDYNIAPLFVEENYLIVTPSGPQKEVYDKIAKCTESLAIGDTVENKIRSNQAWSLLPVQACFSSVIPGSVMSGYIHSQINFPSWLGKNSTRNKCDRLLQDITVHSRITTGASKEAINLDYTKMLVDSIVRPLALEGTDGVEKAIEVMNKYHLTRDDLDGLIELTKWPNTRDPMQAVDSKVKAAFTKAYNKSAMFSSAGTMKKKAARDNDELVASDEEGVDDNDEEEKIENDKMIKAKTTKAKKSAPVESKEKGKKTTKTVNRTKKK